MNIDGIKVTVTGDPYPNEIEGYVRRGLREHGKRRTAMEITLDGADCDIHEHCKQEHALQERALGRVDIPPGFDSIRANQCVICAREMPEGNHVCKTCLIK